MKHQKTLLISIAYALVFLLSAFLYLFYIGQPEFHYFAQQPPFQTTKHFFHLYTTYPGGIVNYISLFISQFFYYNFIGSAIITTCILLFLFLGYKILEDLAKTEIVLFSAFLPAILLLSLFNNYYFPFISAVLIFLVLFSIFISKLFLKSHNSNWYLYFLIAPALYYSAGGASLILYSAGFLILILYYSGLRKSFIAIIAVCVAMIAIPFVSYKYIFNIPITHTFFEFYPDDNLLHTNYSKSPVFYIFFFSIPFLLLLLSFISKFWVKQTITNPSVHIKKNKSTRNSKDYFLWYKKFSLIWILLFLTGLSVILIYPNPSAHQNNIVKADFYCSDEKWEKAIATILADKDYDVKFNYIYNRAIDHTGQYLNKYFNYPQLIGASGTFPDKLNYELLYIYYSDFYFDLGYISESQQWGFKALSGFPYCPRILKRLVITNLILENYNIAGKLLEILDDNMLSKDFVDRYLPYVSSSALASSDKEIMTKRSLTPSNVITATDVADRYLALLDKNKENKRAYEHMQMNSLLNHQLGTFYHYLDMASNYYKTLPRVFEEALLIIKNQNAQVGEEYEISQAALKTFSSFSGIYSKYGSDKTKAKLMLSGYKQTLYYYTMFDSPVVTKRVPVKAGSNEYNL